MSSLMLIMERAVDISAIAPMLIAVIGGDLVGEVEVEVVERLSRGEVESCGLERH
jgi:hypothetical protein